MYIKPSNFLTVIDEKEKRISGVIFDFLTQERKYFLKFNFKMEEEEYFYLWLNSNDFEHIKEEQVLNQENKIFLEILKSTKYLLWNIDFENFKKIIIENILLENY
ncbi:hypothetical protein [Spiroplasma endosymbiont of Zeiraphera isertana]|uniref:hypothetical protein n=1 Tax=Spiroplasma endosymbiont of Zeiraphera isertana TaxID=3066313 RepID=UPI00313B1D55